MTSFQNILVIGGTDPSGGAGIPADSRVVRAHNMWPCSVVTAVVAQNTRRVTSWEPVSELLIADQLDAVFDDFRVDAVKIGMVGTSQSVGIIVDRLRSISVPIVVDPVLSDGTGDTSLSRVADYEPLFRLATIVTPNSLEFDALDFGDTAYLLKAGHNAPHGSAELSDALVVEGEHIPLAPLRRYDFDPRGTGCHLATAIACGLAERLPLLDAVERARRFLNDKFRSAEVVGSGRRVLP